MRLIIQSSSSGRFLCPDIDGGEPSWVRLLRDAGGGVVGDVETAMQLMIDHADFDDCAPVIVDLDRLGTANDYPI